MIKIFTSTNPTDPHNISKYFSFPILFHGFNYGTLPDNKVVSKNYLAEKCQKVLANKYTRTFIIYIKEIAPLIIANTVKINDVKMAHLYANF